MSEQKTSEQQPIVLGLWPIAGVTTLGVTQAEAQATIATAIDLGITAFDTAFSYGYDGESDKILKPFLAHDRDRFVVIGKVGQRWTPKRERVVDGSAKTLTADAELSLRRLGIDSFDVLMLHSPDPQIAIETSAEAIVALQRRGLCQRTGVSNVTPSQFAQFASVARGAAIECPLNLLQQDSLAELIPESHSEGGDVYVFWTLMKGLLAGKITREHTFAPGDSRANYPVFQGAARQRAHAIVDRLETLGKQVKRTVAQLAIGWAVSQPGVTAALVGARRPEQIRETCAATRLPAEIAAQINEIVATADSQKG
ncbi:aldo/keto reductase [Novipirellula galeiformis]|nr:aldo/keto reductase [Novipirellula galeiformis]